MQRAEFLMWIVLGVIVGIIVLLVMSFSVVRPTEMAVKFHFTSLTFNTEKIYSEGRFFTGVGYKMVKFPRTRQIIRFGDNIGPAYEGPLSVRSSDGLKMNIELAFMYELHREPEDLVRLYRDYGDPTLPPASVEGTGDQAFEYSTGSRVDSLLMPSYSFVYARIFASVIRNVAAKYPALDYFSNRPDIAEAMRFAMNETLFYRFYASVPSVELLNIQHAQDDFSAAIESTQIANQDIQQAENEQAIARVQAQQEYDVAVKNSEVLVITANQTRIQTLYSAERDAEIVSVQMKRAIEALNATMLSLEMQSNDELLQYLYVTHIQSTGANKVIASLAHPSGLEASLQSTGVST